MELFFFLIVMLLAIPIERRKCDFKFQRLIEYGLDY